MNTFVIISRKMINWGRLASYTLKITLITIVTKTAGTDAKTDTQMGSGESGNGPNKCRNLENAQIGNY